MLLFPFVPARVREWAYAGSLVSAIVTHVSIRDIPLAFAPSTITTVLRALSYYFWFRLEDTQVYSRANLNRRANPAYIARQER